MPESTSTPKSTSSQTESTSSGSTTTQDPTDQLNELLRLWAFYKEQMDQIKGKQDIIKTQLDRLFDSGLIPDKYANDVAEISRVERSSWTYSPAVKRLQEQEQLDGMAVPKQSSHWRINVKHSANVF